MWSLANIKESIGKGTYWGSNSKAVFYGSNPGITIGNYCCIAEEVVIMGSETEHHIGWFTTFPLLNDKSHCRVSRAKGKTIIGNDVWIGYGATILAGVTIGDGAVIGAKSVITNSVDAYDIYAGNPAKYIGSRFTVKEREKLLKLKWWDWDEATIKKYSAVLCSPLTEEVLDQLLSEVNCNAV